MSLIYEYKSEKTARKQDTSLACDSLGNRSQLINFNEILLNEMHVMMPQPGK